MSDGLQVIYQKWTIKKKMIEHSDLYPTYNDIPDEELLMFRKADQNEWSIASKNQIRRNGR